MFGVEGDIVVNIKCIVFRFIHTIKLTLRTLERTNTFIFIQHEPYEIKRSGCPGVGVLRERYSGAEKVN